MVGGYDGTVLAPAFKVDVAEEDEEPRLKR
jgi:hypothetical protein